MTRSVKEWIGATDDSPVPPRVKLRVFEAHGGICAETGVKIRSGDAWDCDHEIALINGGENRESNLRPVLRTAHREKTKADISTKVKNDRVRKKALGLHKPKNKLPGGRGSKFKIKVGGQVVPRERKDQAVSRNTTDWNYDRIHSAQALIADCQNDMMRCLHKGEIADVVRQRMVERLQSAAETIKKLILSHD
jgi:hypothetical protein